MVSVPVIITVYGHMVQAGNIATANHKYNHKYNNISGVSPQMMCTCMHAIIPIRLSHLHLVEVT